MKLKPRRQIMTMSRPGSHSLLIDGVVVCDERTEIAMVRKAKTHGVDFARMEYQVLPVFGRNARFKANTAWF
jgi:hypothetical protein